MVEPISMLVSWAFGKIMDKSSEKTDISREIQLLRKESLVINNMISRLEIKVDELVYYSRVDLLPHNDDVKKFLKLSFHGGSVISYVCKKLIMNQSSFINLVKSDKSDALRIFCEDSWDFNDLVMMQTGSLVDGIRFCDSLVIINNNLRTIYDANNKLLINDPNQMVVILGSVVNFIGNGKVAMFGKLSYAVDEKRQVTTEDKRVIITHLINDGDFETLISKQKIRCNKNKWKNEYITQSHFICETCKFKNNYVVCRNCYFLHHKDHKGSFKNGRGFCDCDCSKVDQQLSPRDHPDNCITQ